MGNQLCSSKPAHDLCTRYQIIFSFLSSEFYVREAQREANEEAKAEYNPAAYGMNRAEEQLLGYHGAGPGPVVASPAAAAAEHRYPDANR